MALSPDKKFQELVAQAADPQPNKNFAALPKPGIDALDAMERTVAGNSALIAHPNVAAALHDAGASPTQSSVVSQYLDGLRVNQMVNLYRSSGSTDKLPLTQSQQDAAKALGVDLTDVVETPQSVFEKQSKAITDQGLVPIVSNGHVVGSRPKSEDEKKQDGWFDSFGGFFHHLTKNPFTNTFNEAWNVVDSGAAGGMQDIIQIFKGPGTGSDQELSDEQKHIIKALGYDDSTMSRLALEAKGLDVGDVSKLVRDNGIDRVTQAAQYLKDPQVFMQSIADSSATPEEAAKRLKDVSSDDFQRLVQQYRGGRPTIGNMVARAQLNLSHNDPGGAIAFGGVGAIGLGGDKGSGVDPGGNFDPALVKGFNSYSGAIDFAASMLFDPTLVAGKLAKATKLASAGMDSLQDIGRFHQIMTEGTGVAARRAQFGLRNAVDNANRIHEADVAMQAAHASGSADEITRTTAAWRAAHQRFDSGSEVYTPIKDQLLGKNQFIKYDEKGERVIADGDRLDTFDKALAYLSDQQQVSRLASGKAARDLPYAPGAMSSVAVTRIKQALAGNAGAKRAIIDLRKPGAAANILPYDDAVELRTGLTLADKPVGMTPAQKVEKLQADLGSIQRDIGNFQPGAADGATTLSDLQTKKLQLTQALALATKEADATEKGLASAARGASTALDRLQEQVGAAGLGEAEFLARGGGSANRGLFQGGLSGLLSPAAALQRAKLAARRIPTGQKLGGNLIDITNQSDREGLIQLAKTYLSRAQVDAISALWDSGDASIRRNLVRSTRDQVGQAAGLSFTKAGREILDRWSLEGKEMYAVNGHSKVSSDPLTGKTDQAFAVFPGQVQPVYSIPDFNELHKAAAKIGLFESTLGKAFTSRTMDKLFNVLRFGMLAVPRTVPRNTMDTRLMMASRGLTEDLVSAKAWLADEGALPERHVLSRLGMENYVTGRIGEAYRGVMKEGVAGEGGVNYLDEVKQFFPEDFELAKSAWTHRIRSDVFTDQSAADAAQLFEDGFIPARVRYGHSDFKVTGYEEFEPIGKSGADKWSDALGAAMGRTPEYTKAIVRYLEAEGGAKVEAFSDILKVMREPKTAMWVKQMEHSHIVTDQMTGRTSVALTPAEKEASLNQLAWRSINTVHDLLTDTKGQYIQEVADLLKDGTVPEGSWIRSKLPKAESRPKMVIGPTYAPKVVEDGTDTARATQQIATGLQDVTGKFFQRVVEDQMNRTVVLPAYWAFYQKARAGGAAAESALKEAGLSEGTARAVLHRRSMAEARHRLGDYVDDPGLRSQFDIVNRNLVMFPRATFQFINRLWRMERYDPTLVRKWFLGMQGAENSGLVYKDENGELTYTFPGTEIFTDALGKIGHLLGIGDLVKVPVTSTLTGKVALSIPGYDNPFQMSMSPMVNIPLRYLSALAPEHALMIHEIDSAINGQQYGAGQSALGTLIPGPLKRFWDAFNPSDRDGLVSSSTRDALANLYAADPNGTKGLFPVNAAKGSKELQQFVDRVRVGTRNQFFVRALEALFSPSTPSSPGEEVKGVTDKPDAAFYALGVRSMQSEFRQLVNLYKGDYTTALQTWTELHPDMLIYATPTTKVSTPGADIPATRGFEKWVEANRDFIKKNPNTWAYFAPDVKGPFDPIAYKTQLDLGIRKHLTPEEYIGSYQLRRQTDSFFASDDQKKADLSAAIRSGDMLRADQVKSDYRKQSQAYLAANPLVQDVLHPNAESQLKATNAIAELRQAVSSGNIPASTRAGVSEMLSLYDQYSESFNANVGPGSTGRSSMLKQRLTDRLVALVKDHPELTPIYNGVFRKLNIGVKSLASQLDTEGSK